MLARTRLKTDATASARPRRRRSRDERRRGRSASRHGPPDANALTRAVMPAQELSLGITLAVLGAGLLHAGWNALLKGAPGGDPMLDTASVVAGSCVCALVALPFVPLPDPRAWKFIAGVDGDPLRLLRHAGAGVSHRRPVVRLSADARHGAAARRACSASCSCTSCPRCTSMLGILLICARHRQHRVRAPRAPSARGGAAGRSPTPRSSRSTRSSTAPARARRATRSRYVTWLIFLEGLPFLAWIALAARRARPSPICARGWRRGLLGGACSLAAYGSCCGR